METEWHIVYLSFEEGRLGRDYIGKHSTANLCDGYLGSFKDQNFFPDSRIILGHYKTAEAAIRGEMQWQRVFNVVENPQFANQSYQTSTKFIYSEGVQGEKNGMFGKPMSEEAKVKRHETWNKKYGGHPSTGKEGPFKGKKRPEHAEKLKGRKRPEHAEFMRQHHQKRREEAANHGAKNH
jgi:hypothetical protein